MFTRTRYHHRVREGGEDRDGFGSRFREAFGACPVCGGELVEKRAEKILMGGSDAARVEVDAPVCLRCGERLYPEETVRRFETLRFKLSRKDTDGLVRLGASYEAPSD